jgi:hypothetical protein
MGRKITEISILITACSFSFLLLLTSCNNNIGEGTIIFAQNNGDSSRIVSFNPENRKERILTNDFYTAFSPSISYDGKTLVFAGKIKKEEKCQIYKMNLESPKPIQVTSSESDCLAPAILPGGQIVFSIRSGSGSSVWFCNPDGSNLNRITFDPYSYLSSTILNDGRILCLRSEEKNGSMRKLIVMRPDGTKAGLFYISNEGNILQSSGYESSSGWIYFIESSKDGSGNIAAIEYRRPLHTYKKITGKEMASFFSIYPEESGKLLVSAKKNGSEHFSIFEVDPENGSLSEIIYQDSGSDAINPLKVENRSRPKKLPSEVDKGVKTGLLLCQDINFHGTGSNSLLTADKIEVMGVDSILGIVKAEPDGSVYLKVIADTPFRIRTIDKDGNPVQGPGGWIYLRPNERRGCIGCHEDPELVPENKLALSVKKQPVVLPMHISNLKEKEISLE